MERNPGERAPPDYALVSSTEAVYPRHGQPIVAPMLAEILEVSGPFEVVSGSPLRVSDLGASIWTRCSPAVCRRLGTLAVVRMRPVVKRLPARLAAHPLPDPATLMRSVPLENRTYQLLARRLPDLAVDGPWTVARYVAIPGFGARALLDVLASLGDRLAEPSRPRVAPRVKGTLDDVIARVEELHRTYRAGTFRNAPSSTGALRSADATRVDEAVALLAPELPLSEPAARQRLRRARIVMETADLSRLLTAATRLGQQPPFAVIKLGGEKVAVRRRDVTVASNAYAITVRIILNRGLATVEDVLSQLSTAMGSRADALFVGRILTAFRGFEWLHQPTGWFWLRGRSSPLTDALAKIFCVVTRLPLDRLHRALFRGHDHRLRPPGSVAATLGLGLPGARLDGDQLTVARPFDRALYLSADERTLVDGLEAIGGAVSPRALGGAGPLRSLARRTLLRLLRSSPLLEILPDGRFCLIGARAAAAMGAPASRTG
jgi:hypothetical protein